MQSATIDLRSPRQNSSMGGLIETAMLGTFMTMNLNARSMIVIPAFLAVAAAAWALPFRAHACSCVPCTPYQFSIGENPVPSTLPGIYWGGLVGQPASPSSVALYEVIAGEETPVDVELSLVSDNLFLVAPKGGFAEQRDYI